MTPQRWQRVEELYHAATERPAALRSGFLAQACGDDTDLRQEVESLLAQPNARSNDDVGLDRPAWENAPSLLDETRTQLESAKSNWGLIA